MNLIFERFMGVFFIDSLPFDVLPKVGILRSDGSLKQKSDSTVRFFPVCNFHFPQSGYLLIF